jgi:hypothetical protein
MKGWGYYWVDEDINPYENSIIDFKKLFINQKEINKNEVEQDENVKDEKENTDKYFSHINNDYSNYIYLDDDENDDTVIAVRKSYVKNIIDEEVYVTTNIPPSKNNNNYLKKTKMIEVNEYGEIIKKKTKYHYGIKDDGIQFVSNLLKINPNIGRSIYNTTNFNDLINASPSSLSNGDLHSFTPSLCTAVITNPPSCFTFLLIFMNFSFFLSVYYVQSNSLVSIN